MKLDSLFATPLATYDLGRELTKSELNFIKNQERVKTPVNDQSINNYLLNDPKLKNLKKIIEKCLNSFYTDIYKFDPDKAKVYVTQSWANYASRGQGHHRHTHPNSFFSGVLYIDVDPSDSILFTNRNKFHYFCDVTQFNHFNCETALYGVKKNTIIIFPSTLEHEVVNRHADNTRISLAFNSFVKGTLGNNISLTELIL